MSIKDIYTKMMRKLPNTYDKTEGTVISDIAKENSSPVSMHDFRIVKGTMCTKLLFDVSVSNDMPLSNEQICHEINDILKKVNPLFDIILTVDRDYFSSRYENL